ncbi:hypothetical protein ACLOJK_033870 [Asimina triloba]
MAFSAASPLCFHLSPTSPKNPSSSKFRIPIYIPPQFPYSHLSPPSLLSVSSTKFLHFQLCSALQAETPVQDEEIQQETSQGDDTRRKLYVVNLPWDLTAPGIKDLFAQCGTVKDVEVVKQKNGKSRGFAFVTMASAEEARAAIDKFESSEVQGRTIGVEFAKKLKRPSPPKENQLGAPKENQLGGETSHQIYVSNLAWKVRSSHLREFFSANYNDPISARVVFESHPSGRSAGYGFVSFATKEEAEAAITALDGKEFMGRPLRLKISERKAAESSTESTGTEGDDGQLKESQG